MLSNSRWIVTTKIAAAFAISSGAMALESASNTPHFDTTCNACNFNQARDAAVKAVPGTVGTSSVWVFDTVNDHVWAFEVAAMPDAGAEPAPAALRVSAIGNPAEAWAALEAVKAFETNLRRATEK